MAFDIQKALTELTQRRDAIKKRAPLCANGEMSLEYGKCAQGDMTLFAGISCLAAYYAGDQATYRARCDDVANSQGSNGRWWRGPTRVDIEDRNSFSRDMLKGVLAYFIVEGIYNQDEATRREVREKAIRFVEFIDGEGKGRMCKEATDNRCNITQGSGAQLYSVLDQLGLIEELEKRNIKSLKKWSKHLEMRNPLIMNVLAKLSPLGFQTHLSALGAFLDHSVNQNGNNKLFSKHIDIVYKKDPSNPFYSFLYQGATQDNIQKALSICPANRIPWDQLSLDYYIGPHRASWSLQRDMRQRFFEINDGHDCIFILNLLIADLNGNIPWSRRNHKLSQCPSSKEYLGEHSGKPVCNMASGSSNSAKCHNLGNQVFTSATGEKYCLKSKKGWYKALKIKAACPTGMIEKAPYHNYPVCFDPHQNIGLYRCKKSISNVYNSQHNTCLIGQFGWFVEVPLNRNICPEGYEYIKLGSDNKPICKAPIHPKISQSRCEKKKRAFVYENDYCLIDKKGYFNIRKLK